MISTQKKKKKKLKGEYHSEMRTLKKLRVINKVMKCLKEISHQVKFHFQTIKFIT